MPPLRQCVVLSEAKRIDPIASGAHLGWPAYRTPIKTTLFQTGKPSLRPFHYGHGNRLITFSFHESMMQDIPILVFHNTGIQSQFDRYPRFPFANPLGVGLKEGEDLFLVGNRLALEHPPVDLIDLAMGMAHKADDLFLLDRLVQTTGQLPERFLRSFDQRGG